MRAKPFTFKKTRRVVTVHRAISVDLTVKEAAELLVYIGLGTDVTDGSGTPVEVAMGDLYDALKAFVEANQ